MNSDQSPILPQLALIVSLVVFGCILVWIFVSPRSRWRRDSRIPLSDDETTPPRENPK